MADNRIIEKTGKGESECERGYIGLRAAIVRQAIDDYAHARKNIMIMNELKADYLAKYEKEIKYKAWAFTPQERFEERIERHQYVIDECEYFFRGVWCDALCGFEPEMIIKHCEKKAQYLFNQRMAIINRRKKKKKAE